MLLHKHSLFRTFCLSLYTTSASDCSVSQTASFLTSICNKSTFKRRDVKVCKIDPLNGSEEYDLSLQWGSESLKKSQQETWNRFPEISLLFVAYIFTHTRVVIGSNKKSNRNKLPTPLLFFFFPSESSLVFSSIFLRFGINSLNYRSHFSIVSALFYRILGFFFFFLRQCTLFHASRSNLYYVESAGIRCR